MTDAMKIGEVVIVDVTFPCPYCGKPAGAYTAPSGQGVIHDDPPCKDFERVGVLEFVTTARRVAQTGGVLLS